MLDTPPAAVETALGARSPASLSASPPDLPVLPDPTEVEDLGALSRAFVEESRERLHGWHDAGASGVAVVERWTHAIDQLIEFLFGAASAGYRRRYVQLDQRCAVLAQGGYGRAELNPQSDIDLLFLYPHKVTPYVETVNEKILYTLWDTRLQVGFAVRTVAECVRLAATDLKIKTALIDARYVCGDRPLAEEFTRGLERDIKPRATAKFFREKLNESQERHHEYGDSVYLLEPQLKEGQGGLRDLHTALWIAKIKFKVSSLRELAVKGVMNATELAELEHARDFLFRVRNAMHFLTRSHQDQLTFDLQEQVATNLGYAVGGNGNLKPVERFLKDYYLQASAVTRFAQAIIDRSVNPPRPYRLIGRMMARAIRPGIQIVAGELTVASSDIFAEDPTELMRVFADAQRHGVAFSASLADLVRTSAHGLGETERTDARVVATFLEILRSPYRVYETLHEMHKLGVLSRMIPEWEHLRCLVLHDLYHIYTVDQHSLMGIRELERLRNGERADSSPLLTQVMREVERVELLFLGIMMHDSGKGLGGGHSEKGARFAVDLARRLGLNEDDARELEFLVKNHLVMSHLAQRRDIHDDKLIREFATLVGTTETLKRLYVLTYADMRATGPKVWNNWKDMLLGEAYLRVADAFARGLEPEDRGARIARIKHRVLAEARASRDEETVAALERFVSSMPDIYFLTTPEGLMDDHAILVRRARTDGLATSVVHNEAYEYSEFTVATPDRPGLFAILTGVLAARGMNIVGARIATSDDGIALDAFRVSHLERRAVALDEDRWIRTRELLDDVLGGRRDLGEVVALAEKPGLLDKKRAPRVPTEIVVTNEVSDEYTVVDVYTHDRVGLLYRIAQALYGLGLDIHIAKISTNVDQVLDVFYVTEADQAKSTRVGEIESALIAALREESAAGDGAGAPAPG
ncbi:MAG: [protein-PII] uridylyltransferase [Deltaproteobacteria bacterium]|nr:[protein-PII] uridylyltransferase [Deltaproteobacteria bacterium]